MIHLHWAWNSTGRNGTGPAELLRGVTLGYALCDCEKRPRAELTPFLDDTTCPECKRRAHIGADDLTS